MTATEPASLDAILAAAVPVEAEPFDLDEILDEFAGAYYEGLWTDGIRATIARHVNSLRVDTEDARRWVDRLQGECAAKDAAIAEAVRWLERAESYSLSEDCSAAIDDAMAALRGEES